ncbi:HAMP domain-containing protein [Vibrio sp. CAIM 722]|uniref:HAMP domain-containing protein n=1 Tax=Vibrio eleionomae TaxID=2653505 RepID=A0A7X4RW37_9VIBR|nr:methyl-accepting chemotaxis protein [Vibrio eleionomae]MZI95213.1 HAMP domain-containing protein [Vibrio eleionomae]
MLIRQKLYLGSATLFIAALAVLYAVVHFQVTPLIQKQAIQKAQLQAQVIADNLSENLTENATLTRSMAALAQSLPLDRQMIEQHVASLVKSGSGIAGGGIWPEPNKLDTNKAKDSLFWAKTSSGDFSLLDDYNAADAAPYQQEAWYTSAKAAKPGQCVWSEVYVDPVSNVQMVTCSVKIERDGAFWGVATIDVELSGIEKRLITEHEQNGSYGLLVDQAQQLIGMPLLRSNDLAMKTLQQIQQQDNSLTPLVAALMNKQQSVTELPKGVVPDESALLVHSELSKQGWVVGVIVPDSVALAAVNSLQITLYIAFIVLLIVFVGVLLFSGSKLVGQIKLITQKVTQITSGNTTDKLVITTRDEVGELCEAINDYGDHLVAILQEVHREAKVVQQNSSALDTLSQESQQRASGLMEENTALATAINQMSATASTISQDVTAVAEVTGESTAMVQSGFTLIEQSTQSISEMFEKLTLSVDSVEQLSKNSQEVGQILDVIMGISEQTNLLALNAAIEAARAGESGRGFAVVADEVRTLASRTQQSASEIEAMIAQLQNTAKESVAILTACQADSQKVNDSASHTFEQYERMVDIFADIEQRCAQIAVATEEQVSVTDNVAEMAVRIRDITDQNAKDADEFRRVSQDTREQADRLYQISQK